MTFSQMTLWLQGTASGTADSGHDWHVWPRPHVHYSTTGYHQVC